MTMLSHWPWTPHDGVITLTMDPTWSCYHTDHGPHMTMLSHWPWSPHDHVISLTMVPTWRCYHTDHGPYMTMLSHWPWSPHDGRGSHWWLIAQLNGRAEHSAVGMMPCYATSRRNLPHHELSLCLFSLLFFLFHFCCCGCMGTFVLLSFEYKVSVVYHSHTVMRSLCGCLPSVRGTSNNSSYLWW